jgi:predicted RNA-binding protein with RPS1 domain
LDQLPENDAPQASSENQPLETETPRPVAEDTAPPESAPLTEQFAETESGATQQSERSAPEAIPPMQQPVPPAQPERSEDTVALQAEGAEAEPAAAVAAQSSAETPEPAGKTETPAAPSIESEVAAAAEPGPRRPQAAPARPAKPSGPRLADLQPGMVMEGTVTRIEKYGAFVNLGLADRRDGLIHISELAPYRIRRVEDVVQVGSSVRARVVSVDMGRGRIALSLNDVDAMSASEASAGPSEPALTAMALAFQQAQSRRQEQEREGLPGGEVGSRKKREQEALMQKLRVGNEQ